MRPSSMCWTLQRTQRTPRRKQNRNALEARFVAKEIAELLQSGFPVSGWGRRDPSVRPDDIAILLRSPGPVRRYYTQALEEQGWAGPRKRGRSVCCLRGLSGPLLASDHRQPPAGYPPLLAVLRSPLVGMTGTGWRRFEAWRRAPLHRPFRRPGAQGWEDCRSFLDQLEALRFGAGRRAVITCSGLCTGRPICWRCIPPCPAGKSAGRIYSPSMNWPDGLRERDTRGSSAFSFIWTGYGRAGACRRCRPRPRRRPG